MDVKIAISNVNKAVEYASKLWAEPAQLPHFVFEDQEYVLIGIEAYGVTLFEVHAVKIELFDAWCDGSDDPERFVSSMMMDTANILWLCGNVFAQVEIWNLMDEKLFPRTSPAEL